jgi:hypothetical protein
MSSDNDPEGVQTVIDSGVCGLGALKCVSIRGRISQTKFNIPEKYVGIECLDTSFLTFFGGISVSLR